MTKISSRSYSYARRPSWSQDSTYAQVVERQQPATSTEPAEPNTWVYCVLDREASELKVGWTTSVKRRVRELSKERGRELELIGAVRGSYELERLLHVKLADFRVPGTREWYRTEIVADLLPVFTPSVELTLRKW